MTEAEKNKLSEVSKALDLAEQVEIIKGFDIRVVVNELERREAERIELLKMLDGINAFMGEMSR